MQQEKMRKALMKDLHLKNNAEYEAMIKKFVEFNTNLERLNFVYAHKLNNGCFMKFVEDRKDNEASKEHRMKAKVLYKGQRYVDAQKCYTKSLALADAQVGKAEAYANRSAALIKLLLYKECIADCDRALQNGYPEKLVPILIKRKQRAMLKVRHQNSKYYEAVPFIPEINRNSALKCASDSIEIRRNEKYGRHIVATKDIAMGDVLVVEKPYATFVLDGVTNHCHHCLELCYNLVPCDNCTWAMFCNDECKRKATEAYHTYECKIAATLKNLGSIHGRFCTRIILKGFRELLQEGQDVAGDTIHRSNKFEEILQLEHCMDKLSVDHLLTFCGAACEVYHLVKNHTSFLKTSYEHEKFKDLILMMILIQRINSFTTSEKWKRRVQYVATALYPGASLFNHSCCHNVASVFYGEIMVMRACKTIRKGEQCFITYGPRAMRDFFFERQEELQAAYHFECECKACEEEWLPIGARYTPIREIDVWAEYNLTSEAVMRSSVDEVEKLISNCRELLKNEERHEPNSTDYHYVQSLFGECIASFGNRRKI